MNVKAFSLFAQGASHIKKHKECQDHALSDYTEEYAISVVCDGHGGDDYVRSAIGSKVGCEAALSNIRKFLKTISKEQFQSDPENNLRTLKASIINAWNEHIKLYHHGHPFTDEELSVVSEKARKRYVEGSRIESAYGTTMIAVAVCKDYWFGLHIGDGKCVAINPEGEFKQPIPWDEKCFLNATTSICDSDAIERFRHFYSEKLPAAVFVGSDGIDDCFSNNEQLHNLYKTVLYSFATTEFSEALEGLKDYLPRLSAKGSGDDVSIAAILDLDLISSLSIVKGFDREKEKARVEENARKEALKNEEEKRRVEEEHARFIKQSAKQTTRWPKYCENCGSKIQSGVKFCSNCGSKISLYETKENETQSSVKILKVSSIATEKDHKLEFTVEESTPCLSQQGDGEIKTNKKENSSGIENLEKQEKITEENNMSDTNELNKNLEIIEQVPDRDKDQDHGQDNSNLEEDEELLDNTNDSFQNSDANEKTIN